MQVTFLLDFFLFQFSHLIKKYLCILILDAMLYQILRHPGRWPARNFRNIFVDGQILPVRGILVRGVTKRAGKSAGGPFASARGKVGQKFFEKRCRPWGVKLVVGFAPVPGFLGTGVALPSAPRLARNGWTVTSHVVAEITRIAKQHFILKKKPWSGDWVLDIPIPH